MIIFIRRKYFNHEAFIFFGILMVFGTLLKLGGYFIIDSDWFWFLAGLAITIEGIIALVKQKQFDKKYKIVLKK
ncbi:hypothetical protein CO037_02755 [Candidatus Pacearchaeota archaeon CG_4_9_14_0_2_um_filter_30_8]|nr:MAG: hypothetical protein CO037_02755 [Candidatus Pacearchaeota archaeon CG_4_9_14_0_2_um_filter_30_8]